MFLSLDDEVKERLEETNSKVNRYILSKNIPPIEYKFDGYIDNLVKKHEVDVVFELPHSRFNICSGITVKSNSSVAIFIQPKNSKGHQNFSLCHETEHVEYDLVDEEPTQEFFNVDGPTSVYTPEGIKQELLANAGAGVKMLPDITIIRFLETNLSFPKFSEMMKMSQAALYVRLVQFLEHRLGMNNEFARDTINTLRYQGKRDSINRALIGTYSNINIKNEIIYNYENSL